MGRALNVVNQIIDLSGRAKLLIRQGQFSSAVRIVKIIGGLSEKELSLIKAESGSEELLVACQEVTDAARKLARQNTFDRKTVEEIIDKIIELEKYELKVMSEEKPGLDAKTLRIVDPYIRELVKKINKLSFVNRTLFSCSGHYPYKLQAYIIVDYDINAKTAEYVKEFHNSMMKIVRNVTNPNFSEQILNGFSSHTMCSYYLGNEQANSTDELKNKIMLQWQLIGRLVLKYSDHDKAEYTNVKIKFKKKLFDDDAVRMVYCYKCDKYIYSNKKACTVCGTDMRVLKLQG